MRLAVALISVLVAGTVSAEPEPWMKKESPDELGLVGRVGNGCPQQLEDYADVARGVLTRSRIAIQDQPDLVLYFDLQCFDLTRAGISASGFYAMSLDMTFGQYTGDGLLLFANASYGNIGVGDVNAIRDSVREAAEAAITDYLKANFDL